MNGLNKFNLNTSLNTNSISTPAKSEQKKSQNSQISFEQMLKNEIAELNETSQKADKTMSAIATSGVTDLHQAALAINKAELNMKFMLEVRNKAINAYKEISRTQI